MPVPRLTFANALAVVALFASLGGTVYAASKINGKEIKKASIAGSKLKADTVGAGQIDEGSLGQVPSAQNADSAATADSAQTVAGVGPGAFVRSTDLRRVRYSGSEGGADGIVLQHGPLQLVGRCLERTFILVATTTAPGAGFDLSFIRGANSTTNNGGFLGTTPVETMIRVVNPGAVEITAGTLVYNDGSSTTAITFTTELNDAGAASTCAMTGTSMRTEA